MQNWSTFLLQVLALPQGEQQTLVTLTAFSVCSEPRDNFLVHVYLYASNLKGVTMSSLP